MPWQTAQEWETGLGQDTWEAVQQAAVPATLADAYDSDLWWPVFKAYADNTLVGENVAFIEAVAGGTEPQTIHDQYVVQGAPDQVNISSAQRTAIEEAFAAGTAGADVFNAAYAEIWTLLGTDSFKRFVPAVKAAIASAAATAGAALEHTEGRGRSAAVDERDPYSGPALPEEHAEAAAAWTPTEVEEVAALQQEVEPEGALSFLADAWEEPGAGGEDSMNGWGDQDASWAGDDAELAAGFYAGRERQDGSDGPLPSLPEEEEELAAV